MLQGRSRNGSLLIIAVALGCAAAPKQQHARAPAPVRPAVVAPEPSTSQPAPPPPAPAEPARALAPRPTPDSPVVLRVSYGNLGTASGSEWAVHADGALRGHVCNEPRERAASAAEVAELHASMQRCKLCELPERHPSGSNADKEIYRVQASWPDLSCVTDVSLQSRFHYDPRAKRCHAILEALLQARVTFCPGELAP